MQLTIPRTACQAQDHLITFIRRSAPADAIGVIAAINAVCAERIYLSTGRYVPTPQWEKVLHTPHKCLDHLLLVPETDGQIIGWCRVFPYAPPFKARHIGEVGVGLLYPFREIGIGTALMQCAIGWSAAQNLSKLDLSVFGTNLRAINLFKKVGFTVTDIRFRQRRTDNGYVDQVFMERLL